MVTTGARLMKYILKQIDDISGNNAITTIEFNTDTLDGVLYHVELFIRGCGFFPPEGALDYVNHFEESEWDEEDFQKTYDPPHVGEMYDSMNLPTNNWPFEPPSPKTFGPQEGHSHHYFDTERNK